MLADRLFIYHKTIDNMLQVTTRRSLSASTLTKEVNDAIADISKQGNRVKDIKFSACSFPGSDSASDDKSLLAAMIIYEVERSN